MAMDTFEQLEQQLSGGRIGRREFMRRASAVGAAGALPSLLVAEAARAAPSRGGHLRVGSSQGSTTDSMDFSLLTSGFTRLFFNGFMSHLTETSPEGDLVPGLASGWESNPGATAWTFELRNDVEFHNGKSFGADDAIASINVHRGEDSTSAVKSLADQIADVKKGRQPHHSRRAEGGQRRLRLPVERRGVRHVPGEIGRHAGVRSRQRRLSSRELRTRHRRAPRAPRQLPQARPRVVRLH